MRRLTLLAAVLALAACSSQDSQQKTPPPPADAPTTVSDFSGPIDARGTEPFWGLKIRGQTLTLTRPDAPDVTANAPGAVVTPGKAVWSGRTGDDRALTVTLYVSDCSDGMGPTQYPMTAEVQLGDEDLHGCAQKAGAPPPVQPAGAAT